MNLTDFTFFKNTPLIDFQNTIHFYSNSERDKFFLEENQYRTISYPNTKFNFVRDRQQVRIPATQIQYNNFMGVNYCTFLSEFEPNTRYYCYVISYRYLNGNVIEIDLLVDGIMTFCQGFTLNGLRNLSVFRKHLSRLEYAQRLEELKNNSDIIKTSSKTYFHDREYLFDDYGIVMQCACDLSADFGNVDDPKIETSEGLTFDKISSPLNLYYIGQEDFQQLMKILAPYAWITQNIRSIIQIPKILLPLSEMSTVVLHDSDFNKLRKFNNNGETLKTTFENAIDELNMSMSELYDLFNLGDDERHLLRSEYTTTEIYTWDGQQLFINNGLLNERTGIKFRSLFVTGFHNEIAVYLENYKLTSDASSSTGRGSFLNDAIYFRNFDDIPILVDNYNLTLSKSANRRELAESRTITNQVNTVFDSDANLADRFYNAASLLSNVSIGGMFGRFADEHAFYKQQKAEFADLALEGSNITAQSSNNGLKIAEEFNGMHMKFSKPSNTEMNKIKKYYKMFGFEVNDENSQVNVRTMTICNYVQFKGSWSLPNVDVAIIEMMKAQFENGVRFWHNNGTPNPMEQDVLNNTFRS